jgi:hypothetical protein
MVEAVGDSGCSWLMWAVDIVGAVVGVLGAVLEADVGVMGTVVDVAGTVVVMVGIVEMGEVVGITKCMGEEKLLAGHLIL